MAFSDWVFGRKMVQFYDSTSFAYCSKNLYTKAKYIYVIFEKYQTNFSEKNYTKFTILTQFSMLLL